MPTPQALLNDIRTGPPVVCKNLELVPLSRNEPPGSAIDYILAAEALDRGILRVAEVDEAGSVPELRAVSEADVAILLLDGEELIGAKQNRILNTDVLLRPQAKKMIPVSCVEQGRWRHTRPDCGPEARAKDSGPAGQSGDRGCATKLAETGSKASGAAQEIGTVASQRDHDQRR